MKTNTHRYHTNLANYFKQSVFFFDDSAQKKPNIRKCAEQPWQQTRAGMWDVLEKTLTDIEFVETKCLCGMVRDLVRDYEEAGAYIERRTPIRIVLLHENHFKVECPFCTTWIKINSSQKGQQIVCPMCAEAILTTNFVVECPSIRPSVRGKGVRIRARKVIPSFSLQNFARFVRSNLVRVLEHPGNILQLAANEEESTAVANAAVHRLNSKGEVWLRLENKLKSNNPDTINLIGHSEACQCACFLPSGEIIITGASDHTLRVWETSSGREIFTLFGHSGIVFGCAVSNNGQWLASLSDDNTVRLWSTLNWSEIAVIPCQGPVSCSFSIDDRLLSVRNSEGIEVWNIDKRRRIINLPIQGDSKGAEPVFASTPHGQDIIAWAGGYFSPELGSITGSCRVHVWRLATRSERVYDGDLLKAFSEEQICCAISPDGNMLAVGRRRNWLGSSGFEEVSKNDDRLSLHDLQDGKCIHHLIGHNAGQVRCCTFSPDGTLFASGGDDTLRLWNPLSGKQCGHLLGHVENIIQCGFSPDATRFFTITSDHAIVKIWSVDQILGTEADDFYPGQPMISQLVFYRGGTRLAVADDAYGAVGVWDVQSVKQLARKQFGLTKSVRIAGSPDGKRLVRGGGESIGLVTMTKTLHMLNPESWDPLPDLLRYKHDFNIAEGPDVIVFSPSGRWLVLGGVQSDNDHNHTSVIEIFDAEILSRVVTIRGLNGEIGDLTFSPGEDILNGILSDGSVYIWKVPSGQEKYIIRIGDGKANRCRFSPDGELLALDIGNGKIVFYSVKDGCLFGQANVKEEIVFDLEFTPDGRHMLIACGCKWGAVNQIIIWDMQAMKKSREVCPWHSFQAISFAPVGWLMAAADYNESSRTPFILTLQGISKQTPIVTPVRFWSFGTVRIPKWLMALERFILSDDIEDILRYKFLAVIAMLNQRYAQVKRGRWSAKQLIFCGWCGEMNPLNPSVQAKKTTQQLCCRCGRNNSVRLLPQTLQPRALPEILDNFTRMILIIYSLWLATSVLCALWLQGSLYERIIFGPSLGLMIIWPFAMSGLTCFSWKKFNPLIHTRVPMALLSLATIALFTFIAIIHWDQIACHTCEFGLLAGKITVSIIYITMIVLFVLQRTKICFSIPKILTSSWDRNKQKINVKNRMRIITLIVSIGFILSIVVLPGAVAANIILCVLVLTSILAIREVLFQPRYKWQFLLGQSLSFLKWKDNRINSEH